MAVITHLPGKKSRDEKDAGMVVDQDLVRDLLDQIDSDSLKSKYNSAISSARLLLQEIPGARSSITEFINTVRSVDEGTDAGAITKAQGTLELKDAIFHMRLGVVTQLDLINNPPATSFEESLQQDLSRDPLRAYDADKNKLQVALNKTGIFTGYLPILALSNPPLDAAKLVRRGIPASSFAGYTILNKQFVAGISLDYILAHNKAKGKKPTANVQHMLSNDKEAQAIIQEFRETVQARYKHLKLTEMTEPHAWWGAIWLWMSSSSEYKAMHACTINDTTASSLKFRKWDFPFASKK
jgi:hypothetical protein